jgi:hypothetical protein
MPRAGFEPTISVFEWLKTVRALDRATTWTGRIETIGQEIHQPVRFICWTDFRNMAVGFILLVLFLNLTRVKGQYWFRGLRVHATIRGGIQKFPDLVVNEIYAYNNKHLLRSNTNVYGGKTHQTGSQNSDTTAPIGRELYRLEFSLEAASPETFGYTLVHNTEVCHFWTERVARRTSASILALPNSETCQEFMGNVRTVRIPPLNDIPEAASRRFTLLCSHPPARTPLRPLGANYIISHTRITIPTTVAFL